MPLQIPVKEKTVSNEGLGFKSPHRYLTENLPVLLAFQTSLSSVSLSNCTLDRIAYILARIPVFLPLKTQFQEKTHHHAWPSHIPILSRLASLSLDNWNSAGNYSAKLPLSVQSSSQNLILFPLPTCITVWLFTISRNLASLTQ